MSENNQNNRPTSDASNQQHPAKGGHGRHNRHRPHRPHHYGDHAPKGEKALTPEAAPIGETAPQQSSAPKQERPNPKKQFHQQQTKRDGKGAKGRNDRPRRNTGIEKRPYNPYETPSREEIELSELRAQIVLKAADGTAPVAYGVSEKPKPVAEPEEAESVAVAATPTDDNAAQSEQKVEVVGVRFRSAGKTYYFDPQGIKAKKGDFAIVETTRGPEFGEVSLANAMVPLNDTVSPLRPLIRIATPADIAHNEENRKKEQESLSICQAKIAEHKLEMKLIDVQYAFDNSKLLFYFSAEGRVDFRELVKDLASVFRTRIELRQIGIRDEAKMLGGIGACGRTLCCSTFLPDFAQVSIKMAKEQNLSLNSSKISGGCGRLMCCLRYESDVYTEEIRKTPQNDSTVKTEDGIGTVIGSNPLAGTVRVILKDSPDAPPKTYHRDSVTVMPKERKGGSERPQNAQNEKKSADKQG